MADQTTGGVLRLVPLQGSGDGAVEVAHGAGAVVICGRDHAGRPIGMTFGPSAARTLATLLVSQADAAEAASFGA